MSDAEGTDPWSDKQKKSQRMSDAQQIRDEYLTFYAAATGMPKDMVNMEYLGIRSLGNRLYMAVGAAVAKRLADQHTRPVDQPKNPFCICGEKNAVCPVHEFDKFVGKPVDGGQLICPVDNFEHRIGHNAVDSGHGARPMGPQICLKCKKTLQDLIDAHLQAAVREARIEERNAFKKLWNALNIRFGASAGSAIGATVTNDFGESWDFQLDRDAVKDILQQLNQDKEQK